MMKPMICIAIILLMFFPSASSADASSRPHTEIVAATYPDHVAVGESFTVDVSISYSYSGWTLADLGIFHESYTHILDYVRYHLTGEAVRSFSLRAIAPTTSMDLHLRVETRYWHQNFWISDVKGSAEFYVKVLNSSAEQEQIEPPTIVGIGENEWYYWNNRASDTCLIWLSGGRAYPDHVTVNPYEMETFGAMKYINDLAERYSVLALHEGTEGQAVPFTNQTFYALGYYPSSVLLKELHDWILEAGYNFTYLVGYSTGGAAAGYEVAVRDPETWASPDGAVIISAPLNGTPPNAILNSTSFGNNLKANVQLLYGEIWSEKLWPQGREFYDEAPETTEAPWYFKRWHLFPDSSHEVWVKEEDGAHYNNLAYRLTAQFVEKSRSLSGKLTTWNDGSIEACDLTANTCSGEQKPKTTFASLATKVGHTLKVKVWLYNYSTATSTRSAFSELEVSLYSSEGYVDTHYTNIDGYEEFVFVVPESWVNKTVKIFATLGGEYRGIYTPTINLTVED